VLLFPNYTVHDLGLKFHDFNLFLKSVYRD